MKKSEMAITLAAQNDIIKANEVRINALLDENRRLRAQLDDLKRSFVVDDGR
jgi:hypothetical protein